MSAPTTLVIGKKNSNSAKRLLEVIESLRKVTAPNNKDLTYTDVLSKAFGFENSSLHEKQVLAAEVLRQLIGQVDLTQAKLKTLGFSQGLFQNDFSRLRSVTTPAVATSKWSDILNSLSVPTVLQGLSWAQEVLPDDGELVGNNEVLNSGLSYIQELKVMLADPELDDAVRMYIEPRIRELELAFRVFPVVGGSLLATEVDKVAGTLRRKTPEMALAVAAAGKSEKGKGALRTFFRAVKTAGEASETVNALVEAGQTVLELGGSVVDLLC
jgi:hypothetical protein